MSNAIGIVEFTSIARGIYSADQMVKATDVEFISTGSVCPGKYIAIVHGEVAAVKESVAVGEESAGEYWVDSIVIPNVDPQVFPAITGTTLPNKIRALGIIESFSLATMVIVADAVLKVANIEAIELRLGTGLGGKSYFTFTGDVASVELGIEAGKTITEEKGMLVNAEIIPSPSERIIPSLL